MLPSVSSLSSASSLPPTDALEPVEEHAVPDPRVQLAYDVASSSAALLLAQATTGNRSPPDPTLLRDRDVHQPMLPTNWGGAAAGGAGADPFDAYATSWKALGTSLRPMPSVTAALRRR